MSDQIKLNVGGFKYEESLTLFQAYPDSMLWMMISGQHKKGDPNSEVFIDRDGAMFHFVMDYLRNSRVFLPMTMPRDSFMNELAYYGIQAREDDILVTSENTQWAYARTDSMVEDDTEMLPHPPMTAAI